MNANAITIVGGGAFAPRLCEVLADTVDLPQLEIRLSARHRDRLEIVAHHASRRVADVRPGWSVQAAGSLDEAVEGATIIVLLVRVGGFEARAWDDQFPRRYGLAGDEGLGPGGIANAWRTLPELARIAQRLRQLAPRARVLNLMAPLGITTRFLLESELDAIGLCELPLVTLDSWLGNAARVDNATWRYAGLNHLGWFWQVRRGSEDVLTSIASAPPDPAGVPVDRLTLEHYGAAPLRYFYEIFDRDAGRRMGLERSPGRASQLKAISERLLQRFSRQPGVEAREAEVRPTPWLDRAVAPVVSAFLGGTGHAGFTNLRNDGKIPELPPELVVEVAANYSATGVSPVEPGPLPARVAGFLQQVGEAEKLTYLAASRQEPALLTQAIRALPLPIPEKAVAELAKLAQESPAHLQGQEQR